MPSPDQVEIPRRAKDAFREHGRGFVVILKRARTLDSKPPSFLVEVLPRVGTQWELRQGLAGVWRRRRAADGYTCLLSGVARGCSDQVLRRFLNQNRQSLLGIEVDDPKRRFRRLFPGLSSWRRES